MLDSLIPALILVENEGSRMSAVWEKVQHPDLSKFLVIAAILFIIGVAGVLTRRNIIVIFMSIELILNAANLNFIAFSRYLQHSGNANAVAGQIFTVAFARPDAEAGFLVPNVIQRINPDTRAVTNACTLPKNAAGQDGAGGFFLRFGPDGSDFAGKLFITAATNQTLYAMTPDGACSPFVSIDIQKWGYPTGLTFTPDGKTMLVGTAQPATGDPAGPPKKGAGKIIQISSAGVVAENPFVTGLDQPCGMLFAPKGFGPYGGQLLVVDSGDFHSPVPMTQPVKRDGRLYGVTASGELTVIASGFANPTGVAFLGHRLVVSDINGDFHVGQRELPDGFLVAIDAK